MINLKAKTVVIVLVALSLAAVVAVKSQGGEDDLVKSVKGTSSSGNTQLEVKSAIGGPSPLEGFKLQGSSTSQTQQQTLDNLQKQGSDKLQPNAGLSGFTNLN